MQIPLPLTPCETHAYYNVKCLTQVRLMQNPLPLTLCEKHAYYNVKCLTQVRLRDVHVSRYLVLLTYSIGVLQLCLSGMQLVAFLGNTMPLYLNDNTATSTKKPSPADLAARQQKRRRSQTKQSSPRSSMDFSQVCNRTRLQYGDMVLP